MATVMKPDEERRFAEFVAGGSTAEIAGGLAAVVLTILGLAHVVPGYMATISAIVIGAALIIEGASVAVEYSRLLSRSVASNARTAEMSMGMTAETGAGIAGVILGVLGLLGLDPTVLTPSALIIFGAALAFSTSTVSRLSTLRLEAEAGEAPVEKRAVATEAFAATSGTQVLVGLSAIVLGILSLVGLASMDLSLIGLLVVGTSILLSGTAVSGRLLSLFNR